MHSLFRSIAVICLMTFAAPLSAADSTQVAPPNVRPGQPIIVDRGHDGWINYGGVPLRRLYTNTRCPKNYVPYVELGFDMITSDHSGNQLLVEYGVCLHSIFLNTPGRPNSHEIIVFANKRYSTFNSAFIGFTLQRYQQNVSDIMQFKWTLICYPPGTNPPQRYRFSEINNRYVYGDYNSCDFNYAPYRP